MSIKNLSNEKQIVDRPNKFVYTMTRVMNDVQEEYQKMVKKNCEIVWFTSIACLKFKVMVMKRGGTATATAIIYLLIYNNINCYYYIRQLVAAYLLIGVFFGTC